MRVCFLVILMSFLTSCAIGTLNDFESGKVLGTSNQQIQFDTNYGGNFQLAYMRGLNDRLDLGANIEYSILSSYIEGRAKYRLNSNQSDNGSFFSLAPTIYIGEGVGGSLGVAYSHKIDFFELYLNPRISYTKLSLESDDLSNSDFFNNTTRTINEINDDLSLAVKVSTGINFYIKQKARISLGLMAVMHPSDDSETVDKVIWLPKIGLGVNF